MSRVAVEKDGIPSRKSSQEYNEVDGTESKKKKKKKKQSTDNNNSFLNLLGETTSTPYQVADFTTETFVGIQSNLKELEAFRSSIQIQTSTLPPDKFREWIRLELMAETEIEKLRKLREREATMCKAETIALNRATLFIDTIMNTNAEPIPGSGGMRVWRDIVDLETNDQADIVLRNDTEPFWQSCIDAVDADKHRACALGTSGIGKTTTTPWLIRMLLEKGKTVVYQIKRSTSQGWVYEFTPTVPSATDTGIGQDDCARHNVTTRIFSELLLIQSLRCHETYIVVDPGTTEENCNPDDTIEAKVIIVASPDSRYWGGESFEKRSGGTFIYYPLWDVEELVAAREYMLLVDVSKTVIRERFPVVAGVPGKIFTTESEFSWYKDEIECSIPPEQAEHMIQQQCNHGGDKENRLNRDAL